MSEIKEAPAPPRGLSRDQLAEAFKRKTGLYDYVDVPEWGGQVKLRAMTGLEAENFMEETKARKEKGETSMYAIISACAVDENDQLLFPDATVLHGQPMKVINRLQMRALRHNGFREEDADEAKKS